MHSSNGRVNAVEIVCCPIVSKSSFKVSLVWKQGKQDGARNSRNFGKGIAALYANPTVFFDGSDFKMTIGDINITLTFVNKFTA